MASSINPNNISVTFPVAGQDNDSQGFRDNFNNIKTNLTSAKTEIEDIQAKGIFKSALTGTTLSNDGAGAILEDFELKDISETKVDKGTNSGSVAIDFSASHFQTVQTSGDIALAFSNFPASGKIGHVTVEINVASTGHKVELPTTCTIGVNELADYNSTTRKISFATTGKYRFKFSSYDSGTSIAIEDMNRSPNRVHGDTFQIGLASSAKTGVGSAGDKAGMIAIDAAAIYVCTNDYDGSANIWKKATLSASS